jgi:hypothetical protein
MKIYEGTSTMKEAKLCVYKGKFNEFTMKKDEDVLTMFNRLNDIVNELRCLDFIVTDKDFSHKFLRCPDQPPESKVKKKDEKNIETFFEKNVGTFSENVDQHFHKKC